MTFSNVPFANLDRFLIVEMASTSSTPTFEEWDGPLSKRQRHL